MGLFDYFKKKPFYYLENFNLNEDNLIDVDKLNKLKGLAFVNDCIKNYNGNIIQIKYTLPISSRVILLGEFWVDSSGLYNKNDEEFTKLLSALDLVSVDALFFVTIYTSTSYYRKQTGGKRSTKLPKKEILGKLRCIYKVPGSRKEHIKHKGILVTVTEYKKLMKYKK